MIGQPLAGKQHQRRAALGPHSRHDRPESVVRGGSVAAIDALDRHAVEFRGIPVGAGEKRLADRRCRDRPLVILDEKQHGQRVANGLGAGLEKFTFLRGPIADGAQDDRVAQPIVDRGSDTDGLQSVVADRPDHAEHVMGGAAEVGGHLPAFGRRARFAQQAREEIEDGKPTTEQQGLVPIMAMKPVVRAEVGRECGGRLMSGAGHMEESKPLRDQRLFAQVDRPRRQHRAIDRE